MVVLGGSLKITEPQNHIMVVLGGSLKIIELWSCRIGLEGSFRVMESQHGWVGKVLKDYRTTEPHYGGVGGVLKDHRAVELSDWIGKVLYSHEITAWLGWKGP